MRSEQSSRSPPLLPQGSGGYAIKDVMCKRTYNCLTVDDDCIQGLNLADVWFSRCNESVMKAVLCCSVDQLIPSMWLGLHISLTDLPC